ALLADAHAVAEGSERPRRRALLIDQDLDAGLAGRIVASRRCTLLGPLAPPRLILSLRRLTALLLRPLAPARCCGPELPNQQQQRRRAPPRPGGRAADTAHRAIS